MYSGHKNPLIYFLPNCYSCQVVYQTGLALSIPEAQSRGEDLERQFSPARMDEVGPG